METRRSLREQDLPVKHFRLLLVAVGKRTVNFPAVTPPLGLLSLAAYLRQQFPVDIRVLDQRVDNVEPDSIIRYAIDFEADVVGFGTLTPWAYALPHLTLGIRQALPDALILIGGPHVSATKGDALTQTAADVAVSGEGEYAFEQVLRAHFEGGGFGHIPGITWRDSSGDCVTNPGVSPCVEDLDSLPFLAYDLLDMNKYWKQRSMAQVPPRRHFVVSSSRGCPYHCFYCHQIFGKRFRAQSAERIVAEVEHHMRSLGTREVEFVDDIFNHDPSRVTAFCEQAVSKNLRLGIAFPNALRVDTLTSETVEALTSAGLYYSACALESGSERIQKYMGKHLNIPRFLEGVRLLVKHGVLTHGFTMLGFPTETENDVAQTIDVTCNSELHTATFFTVTPYPGTEMYEIVKKSHPEKLAGIVYDDRDYTGIMVNCSEIPDGLLFEYQRKAWRRFYLNPKRVYRIIRRYPNPMYLPAYLPMLMLRLGKGFLPSWRSASSE